MIALAVVASLAIIGLALVTSNVLVQGSKERQALRESELSMRTHLQAQVDDLHAKLLSHNWTEYSNTVNQRSAFDRAVAAETERLQHSLGDGETLDEALSRLNFSGYEDAMEGPTIG